MALASISGANFTRSCYRCWKKGHKANDCLRKWSDLPKLPKPNKKKNGHDSSNSRTSKKKTKKSNWKCAYCGAAHGSENCWEKPKNADKGPPDLKSKLGKKEKGVDTNNASIDSAVLYDQLDTATYLCPLFADRSYDKVQQIF